MHFFLIFPHVSSHCKLIPFQQGEIILIWPINSIYPTFFPVGGRPLLSSKGNQISSPPYPLPCERKVLFSETSECQSCWKLSSWDRNKTRLECGYCCGDAEGENFYDCLTFSSIFLLYCTCVYIPWKTIWTWLQCSYKRLASCSSFYRFIPEFFNLTVIILGGRNEWYCKLVGDWLVVCIVSVARSPQWER